MSHGTWLASDGCRPPYWRDSSIFTDDAVNVLRSSDRRVCILFP